jgi:hypothetical protein
VVKVVKVRQDELGVKTCDNALEKVCRGCGEDDVIYVEQQVGNMVTLDD